MYAYVHIYIYYLPLHLHYKDPYDAVFPKTFALHLQL